MRGLRLFIRPIEPGDAPAVSDFLSRARDRGTDGEPGSRGRSTPAWGLLGKLLGDIVAVVELEITAEDLLLHDVIVAPELRRKRIGRAMLREVEQLATKFDRARIVVDDARGASEFFRRAGFEREGDRWTRTV